MSEEDNLGNVLDTINRTIDICEDKVNLRCEKYKLEADQEIAKIRGSWGMKYNEVCRDLIDLINNPNGKELIKRLKQNYMSNTVEKR